MLDGTAPPPSRVPRLDDGTAVDRADALAHFATRADVPTPTSDALPIGRGAASVAIVSALDESGNEVAGVRLPHLVEPVATYTGWNVRPPIDGLPDLMPDFLGSRLPCGGASLQERYADRAEYEARVQRRGARAGGGAVPPSRGRRSVTADAVGRYHESLTGGETGRR